MGKNLKILNVTSNNDQKTFRRGENEAFKIVAVLGLKGLFALLP
jgi:hypothetical protein